MRLGRPGTIVFLLLAPLTAAFAQTSQTISLNGTWDFALAPDAAAADRLAGFYQDGFQGGGFRPIVVPSNWALQGFEEPIYSRARQGGDGFYILRFPVPESAGDKPAPGRFRTASVESL